MELQLFISALGIQKMGFPTHLSVADALVDQQGALCRGLRFMGRGAEGACMEENRGLGRGTLAKDFFFFFGAQRRRELQAEIQRAPLSRVCEMGFGDLEAKNFSFAQ